MIRDRVARFDWKATEPRKEGAMATLMEIRATLNHAGDQIADLPSDKWCGWICYLLDVLNTDTDQEDFSNFLQTLRDQITERLAVGR